MAKLKPCPFCGCEGMYGYYYDPFDGYQGNLKRYRIRCMACGAALERNAKEEAIEAWNRRADDKDLFDAVSNIDWSATDG